jgi:hypothetical protein
VAVFRHSSKVLLYCITLNLIGSERTFSATNP